MNKDLIARIVESVDGADTGEASTVEHWVDTGNLALNHAISGDYHKGLPFGRVVDVFGDPSTGKSLLIYHILANVQKMGGVAILDDTEDAYTKEFGEKIGIKNDELIKLSSLTVEEHFEKVFLGWKDSKGKERKALVPMILEDDPDAFVVVALDSLALLSTRHEQEVKFEKPDMAKAKQIRAGIRMASSVMAQGNILHIISNHVIANVGVIYGPKKVTPGGSSIPFQASVRVELSHGSKIKDKEDDDKVVGVEAHAYVAKNKVSSPFSRTLFEIRFDTGMDKYSGLAYSLVKQGVLEELEGGYYKYQDEKFRKGKFMEWLEKHKDLIGEQTE